MKSMKNWMTWTDAPDAPAKGETIYGLPIVRQLLPTEADCVSGRPKYFAESWRNGVIKLAMAEAMEAVRQSIKELGGPMRWRRDTRKTRRLKRVRASDPFRARELARKWTREEVETMCKKLSVAEQIAFWKPVVWLRESHEVKT